MMSVTTHMQLAIKDSSWARLTALMVINPYPYPQGQGISVLGNQEENKSNGFVGLRLHPGPRSLITYSSGLTAVADAPSWLVCM